VDGGEPGVTGTHAVFAIPFEVVQEAKSSAEGDLPVRFAQKPSNNRHVSRYAATVHGLA
jgi:hypothetical protein